MRINRIQTFLASAVAALALGGVTAASASADYGPGALYQVELSVNIPGTHGGGVWLWVTLNAKGGGDYAGSDCGHGGQGAASDKGDVTWSYAGDSVVIQGIALNGLGGFPTTITIPMAYGHYTGTDQTYITLPGFIPSGIGFSQLQVAP